MSCPLKYRFRVVDRLPEKPSAAAVRGTVVHAVLERLFDLPRGQRTLEQEQDLGLALARAVDPSLRARLLIGSSSLGDIVTGPGRRELFATAPAGVALAALNGDQRTLAVRLVETYARNMRAEIADDELRRMRAAGLEALHFAWAGAIDPARPHYYRLHGPTLLIEYDNTQNDANHIHSVWHDPANDFGADLLRAHYERGHPLDFDHWANVTKDDSWRFENVLKYFLRTENYHGRYTLLSGITSFPTADFE